MLEATLAELFGKIFQVKKVSFDLPDPIAYEQETLFIDLESERPLMKQGVYGAELRGTASITGPSDKILMGFFAKAIETAKHPLTKDLFFYEVDKSTRRYRNIVQRSVSFVYFFSTQFDPAVGSIEEVEITVEESSS